MKSIKNEIVVKFYRLSTILNDYRYFIYEPTIDENICGHMPLLYLIIS